MCKFWGKEVDVFPFTSFLIYAKLHVRIFKEKLRRLLMDSEGKRYEFIREKTGLSKKDFAESLGLSMSMGSQIASNLIKPSRNLLNSLANTYNINLHWFLTGKGPSGLKSDTVDIELLEQEAAAGHGREAENYPEKRFSRYLAPS
jgi:transcriptional regulator with XRE-family HTH domain